MDRSLLEKYNVLGPRYTSYPTVPYWNETPPTAEEWQALVKKSFNQSNHTSGISIYIHLPFCETQCYYCGCNTRITHNHRVEEPYLDYILKEWELYFKLFDEKPMVKEIHLGGGTPTFFSAENLTYLLNGILKNCQKSPDAEFSFEGHPNNTNKDHLIALFKLGFRRISLGVQDFDLAIQKAVNRIQSFEQVEEITHLAREIGYTSVNFDLIYGLPLQTKDTIIDTITKVNQLKPDRIAFYSYAHVPWMKPGQKKLEKHRLPNSEEKLNLYETGKSLLTELGYLDVGMDHFALPHDTLCKALDKGELHRNFMGYTHNYTQLMIGLGVSSISDAWFGFMQNEKVLKAYQEALDNNQFPIMKGHCLTDEDLLIRKHILNIMCNYETSWAEENANNSILVPCLERLAPLAIDGLVTVQKNGIKILTKGKPFLRNICMAFDARLWSKHSNQQLFSKTI